MTNDQAFQEFLSTIKRNFIAEIEAALLGGVESATGRKLPPVVNGTKPLPQPSRAKGSKRDPSAISDLVVQLRAYVAKRPGERIEQIGKAMGVATKDLALPVKKLIAAKQLATKGQKRATAYYLGKAR